jgi:hypothetical protein
MIMHVFSSYLHWDFVFLLSFSNATTPTPFPQATNKATNKEIQLKKVSGPEREYMSIQGNAQYKGHFSFSYATFPFVSI